MPQPISQTDLVAALNSSDIGALNISAVKADAEGSVFNNNQGPNFDPANCQPYEMLAADVIGFTMERPAPTPAPDIPGMG